MKKLTTGLVFLMVVGSVSAQLHKRIVFYASNKYTVGYYTQFRNGDGPWEDFIKVHDYSNDEEGLVIDVYPRLFTAGCCEEAIREAKEWLDQFKTVKQCRDDVKEQNDIADSIRKKWSCWKKPAEKKPLPACKKTIIVQ